MALSSELASDKNSFRLEDILAPDDAQVSHFRSPHGVDLTSASLWTIPFCRYESSLDNAVVPQMARLSEVNICRLRCSRLWQATH
jgi:hypothetical protein